MLYALQLPDGRLVGSYRSEGSEFDFFSVFAAGPEEAPMLVEEPSHFTQWVRAAQQGHRSYDITCEPAFVTQLGQAQIVQVEVSVIGVVR